MLEVKVWNEGLWLQNRDSCDQLLSRSDADPLFHSWDWQTLWWKHIKSIIPKCEIKVYAAFENDLIVGLLPMVIRSVARRGLPLRSAQVIGNQLYDDRFMMSEYTDAIVDARCANAARTALISKLIDDARPQEIVIGWTDRYQEWNTAFSGTRQAGVYARDLDPHHSYQADLKDGFASYVQHLGSSARRSMINLRRRLEKHGEIKLVDVPPDESETALQQLSVLHATRHGRPPFIDGCLRFHHDLFTCWRNLGRVQLSRLWVGNHLLSVLYDIRIGATQYNIQMGFDGNLEAGVSPGLLHLGYAMERAASAGVETYDFLAGPGLTNDYKSRICSNKRQVLTQQRLRGWLIGNFFKAYDGLNPKSRRR